MVSHHVTTVRLRISWIPPEPGEAISILQAVVQEFAEIIERLVPTAPPAWPEDEG
jgi:hypothetical protein